MLYDFSFKTGSVFGAAYSPQDDTNLEASYFNGLPLAYPLITGIHTTRLTLNGQTLVEQTAVLVDVGFSPVYLTSGDYFFKTGETYNRADFNSSLAISSMSEREFHYNLKDNKIEPPVGSGVSKGLMQTGISGQIVAKFPTHAGSFTGIDSFDFFLNGQKIYSGASGSYGITGGSFYYYDETTGKLFGILKNSGLRNHTGQLADVYGQSFVEDTVFGYVNGVSQHPKNWLELHTGVTLIRTGVQAGIFDSYLETESISL